MGKVNGKDNVDVVLYDVAQCFDSLWLEETLNDLYDSGITNRNLKLIQLGNSGAVVGVRDKKFLEKILHYLTTLRGTLNYLKQTDFAELMFLTLHKH